MKKELDQLFNRIKQDSSEGESPDLSDVKQFVRLCRQMQNQALEDWAFEADDFMHLANEFLQSVKQQRIQDILPLITFLEDAKNYCHRTFKEE